jgi:hypothetical protein
MGWLRELMASSGHRSFGELARQALAHDDWPKDTRAQPRSLEAIFGRLDRKEDLEWLQDRPGVQQVLAEVLECQVAELRTVLAGSVGTQVVLTRLRLDDLPLARALELQIEALPPTIPDRVTLPATWRKLGWFGSPGCGFSLARHWLQARGLAQTLNVEDIDQLHSLGGPSGLGVPLFLELDLPLDERVWSAIPQNRPVCLCVKTPGLAERTGLVERGFETIDASSPREHLDGIVDWVLARAPNGVQSRRTPLLDWLKKHPERWGLLETLGDVFGWIGAYIECAEQGVQLKSKRDFLRRWLGLRAAILVRERIRDRAELTKTLPNVLVDLAQSVLLEASGSMLDSRPLEDWLALVPDQHRRGPDLDWLAAQANADPQLVRPRDLERAAKKLPPGAHRIIVGLRELLLLRPTSSNRFALRPHFLNRLLVLLAEEATVSSLPVFWGEALLKPQPRASLMTALTRRIKADPEGVAQELLEIVEADSAPLVGALEASFVVTGLAVLAGVELSEGSSQGLLEEQQALLLDGIEPLPLRRTIPASVECIEDSVGAFYLAAFALSECSRQRRSNLSALFDPWSRTTPPEGWELILDAIADTLQRAVGSKPPWLPGALRLLDRLRQNIGSDVNQAVQPPSSDEPRPTEIFATESTHPVFLPGMLLDAIELSVLGATDFWALLNRRWQLDVFLATLSARDLAWRDVAESIWTALLSAPSHPHFAECLALLPQELWQESPPSQLARVMLLPSSEQLGIPWLALPTSAWHAWSQSRAAVPSENEPVAPWRELPLELGETVARTVALPRDDIRRVIWQRWPEFGVDHVEKNRTLRPMTAQAWLESAPLHATHILAQATLRHGWHRADERVRLPLRRRLHLGIAARAPGWLEAYECLEQIEVERRRSRH